MDHTSDPAQRHPMLRDPTLLIAWIILAALGLIAVTFTVLDRPANRDRPAVAAPGLVAQPTAPSTSAPGAPASSASRGPAATVTTQAPVAGTCPTEGVVIRADLGDAAMGLRTMGLKMINCGRRPYTVRGYPVVQVLAADQSPLDVEVIYGSSDIITLPSVDNEAQQIVLQPGDRADAVLVWRMSMLDGDGGGEYLLTTPRTGDSTQTVPLPDEIDLGNGGRLAVGPWSRL